MRALLTLLDFLTLVAMFVRNLVLLKIFARSAIPFAAVPMLLMGASATGFVWFSRKSVPAAANLKMASPVSIRKIVSFGVLFLVGMAGVIGKR